MRHIDWDSIQEVPDRPTPGGYAAVICSVDDNEDREYLEIRWDFLNPPFQGSNRATFHRASFWPSRLYRSYKKSALRFFKAFKTAVEESNPGYIFDDQDVNGLVNKKIGVVLGEEEYQKQDGTIGRRLYVDQTRSIYAIEAGDFTVPELKTLDAPSPRYGRKPSAPPQSNGGSWTAQGEEDGELPF